VFRQPDPGGGTRRRPVLEIRHTNALLGVCCPVRIANLGDAVSTPKLPQSAGFGCCLVTRLIPRCGPADTPVVRNTCLEAVVDTEEQVGRGLASAVMRAYIHASAAGAEARVLSQCFIDLAELFSRGFLTDASTVWANAESATSSFWALTDRSQYVHIFRPPLPGYVRLTAEKLRWARSYDGTVDKPEFELNLKDIPGGADSHMTFIVKHRAPGQHIAVIDQSLRVSDIRDGTFTTGNKTVIDLGAYRPAEQRSAPGEFEVDHARWHGVHHMMSTVSSDTAKLIRNHLSLFAFDIEAETFQKISEYLGVIEQYGDELADVLFARLNAAGAAAPS